jgi:hypothetical protein
MEQAWPFDTLTVTIACIDLEPSVCRTAVPCHRIVATPSTALQWALQTWPGANHDERGMAITTS